MGVKGISLRIISIAIVLSTPFISHNMVDGAMVYRSEILTDGDKMITSPNYPEPYPPNQNLTWLCSSTTTKWAVVFLDFQLESPVGNVREYDRLELDDGHKPLYYSSYMQPRWPYKSNGHHLRMTFITDSVSGDMARGFKIQLLHGKDDQEIALKIHALKSTEKRDNGDNNQLLLIIVAVIFAVIFVAFAVTTIFCFLHHHRNTSRTLTLTDRNAFGVRRNSGVYHSRNSSSGSGREQHTNEVVIVARQTHRIPPESQPSSRSAPAQRSNSQRDWRARAELCATVTVSSQNCRPNMYSHSGPEPQACGGREPDKVPDFDSFDDCCKKSRKSSKGNDSNNDCSTARKSNPYHVHNNLAPQNSSANQSACAALSKAAAEKKCNNNDYTNIGIFKETNSKLTNQKTGIQEPGSPIYCNSPVGSPTSPGLRDSFMLNVRVGSLERPPLSPTDNCYENVPACQNQERLDKKLQTPPLYMNSPDDTPVKRMNSFQVTCQPTGQDDEFKAVAKGQGDSGCLRSGGLGNILEVKRNRPPSANLYSNWENIKKDNKELYMHALHEKETMAANSPSSSSDFKPNNKGDCSAALSVDIQNHAEKKKERKISDPNAYQINAKVPRANVPLCSTDVKSNDILQDINHSVPCNKARESKRSISSATPPFSLELPAVNTGDYLYLTECGISPHKPEKEWRKMEVSFADTQQSYSRNPKLSTSQSFSSDEGEYRVIPSTHESCKSEESANAMTLQLDAILPKTNISHLSPGSNPNGSGEYHLLPLHNDKSCHGVESATNAVTAKRSPHAMELQLNARVPNPSHIALSSPGNSGEYHFLPSSHSMSPAQEENGLNMKFSPPNSSFPLPEMKDNSKEGEYHYLFQCNQIPKNDLKCRDDNISELGKYKLGTAVPTVSSSPVADNPNDYYVLPKTNGVHLNDRYGDVKFPKSDGDQLRSGVPISKEVLSTKANNCGEYDYVVTRNNDEQDTTQNLDTEETESPKMNTCELDVEVPKPSNTCTTNDSGEYHLVPVRN